MRCDAIVIKKPHILPFGRGGIHSRFAPLWPGPAVKKYEPRCVLVEEQMIELMLGPFHRWPLRASCRNVSQGHDHLLFAGLHIDAVNTRIVWRQLIGVWIGNARVTV